ncbi:MAG: helix-hairpin-helix domain-containing protein [Bacilli bacterium]
MTLTIKIILGALVATIIGLISLKFIDKGPSMGNNPNLSSDLSNKNTISVQISGQISHAGTYIVENVAVLEDLIKIAGGTTSNADELCYFIDYQLESNDAVYIAPIYDNDDVCTTDKLIKHNINECKASDLKNIDGIGDTTANSIIDYRNNNGNFKKLEDVMKINGIKNATFSKLKNYIKLKN